jgi:hypothetical protein
VGYNFDFQPTYAARFDAEPVRAIAVAPLSACFVSCATGETKCVGSGTSGQLGYGQTSDSTALVIATGLSSDVCTTTPTTVNSLNWDIYVKYLQSQNVI